VRETIPALLTLSSQRTAGQNRVDRWMSKIFPGFVDMGEQGHHVLLKCANGNIFFLFALICCSAY